MNRYLLDTNHASAVFKKQLNLPAHPKFTASDEFGIALPSIGELWFMVFNSARIQQNTQRLDEVLQDWRRWALDDQAVYEFGRIKAEARRTGRGIADVDTQIAAIARANGLTLLTDDADFSSVAGLTLDNWLR
jgi:tRNA(fMet)-specific endonuclease VapC